MLLCRICGDIKANGMFFRDRNRVSGRSGYCKSCRSAVIPDDYKAAQNRKWLLKKKFGMSLEEYQEKFEAQGGTCMVCKQPETGTSGRYRSQKQLAVDHDHATGQIRDLLCLKCNTGIGMFCDNPDLLQTAIEYLRKWEVDGKTD